MQNGEALKYASDELRADKKVVLAAVMQNGEALKYASDELRADKKVVLAAVMQNGEALKYASVDLRKGGIRTHMLDLLFAHRAFMMFLLGAMRLPAVVLELGHIPPRARVAFKVCYLLRMINALDLNFAQFFKRRIADFAGVPVGPAWVALTTAFKYIEIDTW
jgi:uncharacterized protein YoaH (UPF0181 family)